MLSQYVMGTHKWLLNKKILKILQVNLDCNIVKMEIC